MEIRVITKVDNEKLEDGLVTLNPNGKPTLMIAKEVEVGGKKTIINEAINRTSIARNDHLDSFLRERDWNITTRLFLDNTGEICMSTKDYYDSDIPNMSGETKKIGLEERTNLEIESRINYLYRKALDFDSSLYSTYNHVLGLLNSNCFENIILENDYTNIINFNRLFGESQSSKILLARVVVSYTYDKIQTNKEFLIIPFKRDSSGKEEKENYNITTPDNKVLLEILDGVLRIFPLTDEVEECIITSCSIFYDNE